MLLPELEFKPATSQSRVCYCPNHLAHYLTISKAAGWGGEQEREQRSKKGDGESGKVTLHPPD